MKKRVFSAMRPTGRLHLGHLVGALHKWVELQNDYDCIFSIVDWHALMGEYEESRRIKDYALAMAVDWLSCGIDPERSILFVQSHVPAHLELAMILGCITPLGWLERNPTYKEQLREISQRDLQTYGFLGYPVLQAADILLYRADAVPIGEDQLPHIELTREIGRRFNHLYGKEYFRDCKAILTRTPRLLGLDGRKMSKSYDNAINLSDEAAVVEKKTAKMFTDPQRLRMADPGRPGECNVYSYYEIFAPDEKKAVYDWCTGAKKGCTECKAILGRRLNETLKPVRERREEIRRDPKRVEDILEAGRTKAQAIAGRTLAEIKELVFGS